jgi:Tol biopolymer transport system component
MPSAPQSRENSAPSAEQVRGQLERVLTSSTFARSERLGRFLTFAVDETLAGRSNTFKESVIASALYSTDAASDSVVRVDARRLRDKLREYYTENPAEAIVITLPKGSYVPRFESPTVVTCPPATRPPRRRRRWIALAAIAPAAIATWLLYPVRTAPVEFTPIPLTSYPGIEDGPSLSPDGNFVAFMWAGPTGTTRHIYVKSVGGDEVRQITDGPGEFDPSWSPDGRYISFRRIRAGVWITSPLGGWERKISETGTWATWTPDSKGLLSREPGPSGPHGIVRFDIENLERRQITQAPVGDGEWRFEPSPDGRNLAIIRYGRTGISDLYVAPISGGEPRRITNWNLSLTSLAWTPDSRDVIYAAQEGTGARLWRIPASTTSPGKGKRLAGVDADAGSPAVSRSAPGKPGRLAYVHSIRDSGLRIVELGGAQEQGVFRNVVRLADSSRIDAPGRWSWDSTRVAFNSNRDGQMSVWVCNRDGSNLYKLAEQGGALGWSPDGQRIAFDQPLDGNTDVYVRTLSGGPARRLTTEDSIDGTPEWSHDGKWIYFASNRAGQKAQIWKMSPDGGRPTQVTRNGGFHPRLSPDGRHVYHLDRLPQGMTGRGRLMRTPVDGGEEVEVHPDMFGWIWDVSAIGIVFLTQTATASAVDLIRYEDHKVVRLGLLPFRPSPIGIGWSVSRDGRWLLSNQIDRLESDLMLIDNFR